MAETTTANNGWTMPDPGASANTWGATLNATTQKIDAAMAAIQTGKVTVAGAPVKIAGTSDIGDVKMFAGPTPPAGWLVCNGASLATTGTYAPLFAVLGYAFGGSGANFSLPDLRSRFPMGAGALGAVGGEATHLLTAAEMPSHAHSITDVAHNHGVNQWAHAHNIATGGHSHGVNDPGHTHTYATLGGGVNIQPGSGGNMSNTGSTGASGTGISIQAAGNLGGNTDAQTSAVSLNASGTGLSATNANGGGAAHNNLPPYQQINFVIRFQ